MNKPTRYFDPDGHLVEVAHRNPRTGNHHRVKSQALPPRRTPEKSECDLVADAARKRWPAAPSL